MNLLVMISYKKSLAFELRTSTAPFLANISADSPDSDSTGLHGHSEITVSLVENSLNDSFIE
jgi:hypothetical protein